MKNKVLYNVISFIIGIVAILAMSLIIVTFSLTIKIKENKELIKNSNAAHKIELDLIKSEIKKIKDDVDYLFIDLYYIEDTTTVIDEMDLLFPK